MAAKRKYVRKTTLFVAVVVNEDLTQVVSDRRDGDYSCFLSTSKNEVIQAGLRAKAKWDGYISQSTGKKKVYRVLVGKLSSEAAIAYSEVTL